MVVDFGISGHETIIEGNFRMLEVDREDVHRESAIEIDLIRIPSEEKIEFVYDFVASLAIDGFEYINGFRDSNITQEMCSVRSF